MGVANYRECRARRQRAYKDGNRILPEREARAVHLLSRHGLACAANDRRGALQTHVALLPLAQQEVAALAEAPAQRRGV